MDRLKDSTFSELVDDMTRHVHTSLLEDGGKGMRQGMWLAMQTAIQWKETQDKKDKTGKKPR